MPTRTRRSKSNDAVRIDFTQATDGGRTRVPEGDYKVAVKKIERDTSKASGNPMLVWDFVGLDGKLKGKGLRDYTALTAEAAWKVRDILNAIGINVPAKVVNLPLKPLVGRELGVTVIDDEYEGRTSSKIADYIDLETLAGGDVDDEEDEDEEEPEADESDEATGAAEEEDDGYDELALTDLKAELGERGLKTTGRKAALVARLRKDDEEAEEEGDEDEPEAEGADEFEELDLDNDL